jgi:hypothetical protein
MPFTVLEGKYKIAKFQLINDAYRFANSLIEMGYTNITVITKGVD